MNPQNADESPYCRVMTEEDMIQQIPGADDFIKFFGYFPSFHDAVTLELCLKATGHSYIDIYTFEMSSRINDEGYYINEKEVIAHITCNNVFNLELSNFSYGNMLDELKLHFHYDGFELIMIPNDGLGGSIYAREIFIEFAPITEEQRTKYQLRPSAQPL